jgi:rubrerythrin
MTRARRLLTLAYKAHQRGEQEIASRIAILAFDEQDSAPLFEKINKDDDDEKTEAAVTVQNAEAILRKAEGSTNGSIFTEEGVEKLLAIAKKIHQAGFPKVAKSIARAAQ